MFLRHVRIILSAIVCIALSVAHSHASTGEATEDELMTTHQPPVQTGAKVDHDEQNDIRSPKQFQPSGFKQPATLTLAVPFTSQAPFEDWNEPFQNACEEANLIMIDAYFKGETLTPNIATERLLALMEWQKSHGFAMSVSLEQASRIAKERLGYDSRILENLTRSDIEATLAAGHPVIVPTAGRMLRNPHFVNGGPWYHMLTVIGHDDDSFIVNDPGTAVGEAYRYQKNILLEAIHDHTGQDDHIGEGPKRGLVIFRPQ